MSKHFNRSLLAIAWFCGALPALTASAQTTKAFVPLESDRFASAFLAADPDALYTSLYFIVPFGSRDEGELPHGIAHYAEHLLASAYMGERFDDTRNRRGNAFTSTNVLAYYSQIRDESQAEDIDRLSRIFDPITDFDHIGEKFSVDEVGVVAQEYYQRQSDDPSFQLWIAHRAALFGADGLSRVPIGDANSIKRFTPALAEQYRVRTHIPSLSHLIVHGNMDEAAANAIVGQADAYATVKSPGDFAANAASYDLDPLAAKNGILVFNGQIAGEPVQETMTYQSQLTWFPDQSVQELIAFCRYFEDWANSSQFVSIFENVVYESEALLDFSVGCQVVADNSIEVWSLMFPNDELEPVADYEEALALMQSHMMTGVSPAEWDAVVADRNRIRENSFLGESWLRRRIFELGGSVPPSTLLDQKEIELAFTRTKFNAMLAANVDSQVSQLTHMIIDENK